MTEPKIRFKRDDGSSFPDWEEKTLGEVCEPLQYGMGAAATAYDGENRYIRITDIDDSSHKYMQTDIVSPSGDLSDKYLVHNGDILLARTGASTGKSYLYNESDGKMYFAGFLIRAHVKEEYSPYFIFAQTLTEQYGKWVKQTSMRGAQPGINSTEYSMYCFNTPSLPEQQKIADFLSNVDEVIAASEEEVANLEQQKKAVMQKIFSQEVRFKKEDGSDFPDWKEKKLGSIAVVKVGEKPKDISEKKTGYKYINAGTTNSGYVDEYNCEGNTVTTPSRGQGGIGFVGYQHEKFWLGPLCYKIQSFCEKVLTKYIYYFLFFNSKMITDLKKVGTIPAINRDDLIEIYIDTPSLPEQQLIADFLTSYDEAITAAKQELEKWKELKKGLLQQMFV